jgi:hypothetical protein
MFLSSLIRSRVSAGQSQWSCGLRHGSVASHLVELQVLVPVGAWVSVASFVCCQVEVSVMGCSLIQRSPTVCGVFT